MPTYVCSVPFDLLTSQQKQAIAKALSTRHSEATGAAPFFVQVVIEESATVQRFLGGELTSKHIWVRGDIRAWSHGGPTNRHDAQHHEGYKYDFGSARRFDLGLCLQSVSNRYG